MAAFIKAVKKGKSAPKHNKQSKHQKLPENWGDSKEPVKYDGVTFYLKYLGSTLVEELEDGHSYGDAISSEAVKTIVNMAKLSGKKLEKTSITVSTNGIQVYSMDDKRIKTNVTIYRVSFCTADRNHGKVFAYIARSVENETMECHAFLCPKNKVAQAVALTVAEAFKIAQEEYNGKNAKDKQNREMQSQSQTTDMNGHSTESNEDNSGLNSSGELLNSGSFLSSNECSESDGPSQDKPQITQGFEDNFSDEFNVEDDFSCLAKSRSHTVNGSSINGFEDNFNSNGYIKQPSLFGNFSVGFNHDELEEGVGDLMSGHKNADHLHRAPSIDELLCL